MTPRTGYIRQCLTVFAIALAAWVACACAAPDPDTREAAAALAEEANAAAARQLARLGEGYEVRFDDHRRLIFVSALDAEHFRQTALTLAGMSDAIRKTLAMQPPQTNVMIVLPTAEDYVRLRPSEEVAGFYTPADRSLISINHGRVLMHEFAHALHHADADAAGQQHPVWVWEGLATLCDACDVSPDGTLDPQVDLRVAELQKAVAKGQTIPLARLFSMTGQAFHDDADLCYAEARYLMLYLHEQGKLPQWYERYKAGFDDDPTGRRALEEVLDKRLFEIEDDWKAWAARLELPWGERRSDRARLGLGVQDTKQGAQVVSLAPHSPAEQAGRILIGDVIVSVNGVATASAGQVIAAVQACGANQTINVELRRRGHRMTVQQPLGAPRQP